MFKHRLNQSIVIGLVFDGRSGGLGVDIDWEAVWKPSGSAGYVLS